MDEPRKEWELRMTIAAAPRSGSVVATLREAVVRRGDFTLGPVSLQIDWAEKVAITGANGSGKTTLLAALLGRLPLDEGTAALGSGVVVGEVDQARGLFLGEQALLRAFEAQVPEMSRPRSARCWRSSDSRLSTCSARRRRCHRASAHAPRWRCCRPGA